MKCSVVKTNLDEGKNYIICPDHKTAEVARIAEKTEETLITSESSHNPLLE